MDLYILKFKYNWFMVMVLIFSVIMVFNFNSYYYIWIFMELNTLVFLTFLSIKNKYISVGLMKYFLMSALSSIIFMFFISFNMFFNLDLFVLIMNLSMILKLGSFPFHYWFIDMMIMLDWSMCFVLSTIQKIIPLFILMYINIKYFIYLMVLFGGLITIMLSFNHVLLKKIMGFSSLNHLFWMLISLTLSLNLLIIYFFSYFFISGGLFYFFYKFNLNQISDFYFLNLNNFNGKNYVYLMFLSLGGLPPFFGFLMKWLVSFKLIYWMMFLLVLFMILYSMIFLFYYMRVLFNFMLFTNLNLSFNFNFLNNIMNLNIYSNMILFFIFNLIFVFFWFFY